MGEDYELLDSFLTPFHNRFDAAIHPVAHPTGKAKGASCVGRPIAVKYALDAAHDH